MLVNTLCQSPQESTRSVLSPPGGLARHFDIVVTSSTSMKVHLLITPVSQRLKNMPRLRSTRVVCLILISGLTERASLFTWMKQQL